MLRLLQPSKRLIFSVVFVISGLFSAQLASAAATVTKGTGGGNLCVGVAGYTTLGNIVITEGANADFSAAGTLILNAPATFQFNTAALPVVGLTGPGISTGVITFGSATQLTINLNLFGANATNINSITISGLQVRAITSPSSGMLTKAGTFTITGVGAGADLADLTSFAVPTPVISGPTATCANVTGYSYSTPSVVGHTYVWSIVGGTITAGAGTFNITVTWGVSGTGTVAVTETNAQGCATTTANYNVTINPVPSVNAVSNITVCSGGAVGAINFTASTGVGTTFNWTNSNTLINLVASGSGNIAGFTAGTNITGVPIVGTISVTGTKTSCTGAATTFTITVDPEPVVTAVANQAACPATAINIPLTSNVSGAVLSWTNTNTAIGIAASGTGDIISTAPTNNTGVDIVGTITVVGTSATCVSAGANRKIFTITIHPTPVVAAVSNITVCSGAAVGAIAFSANTAGGETFNWTNSNTLINLVASGIGNIAGFTAATNTTGVPIVGTISVTGTKATCTGAPRTFTITVNPEPVVTAVANQAFCPATAINIPLTSNVSGAVLSWTNTNPLIGIAASGTGDINYTAPTNNTGVDIAGTITVVGTSATCVSAGANRKIFTITIHPTPVVAAVSNITVCSGGAIGAIAFSANTAGGETFNWTNSNTLINLVASGIGNIAGFTAATNTTGVPIVATISVTGTKATCTGAPTTFTITVNPEPVVAAVANQAVCPATAINIPLTSNVSGAVLSWTNTNTAIGIAASGSGDIISTAPTNNTGVDIVGTITVVGTSATCVSAGANRKIFTITIHPTPVVAAVSNITVCSGAAIGAIAFSANTAGGETFNWTNSNTLINLVASGIGNIAGFTAATNTTGVPIVATISVTGTKATCTGAPTTFTITVNPEPVVAAVANQAVCPATAINIPLTSNTAGAVLSWTNTNPLIGIAASGTGDINYTAPTNNTGVDIIGTITVVGTSATCVSTGANRKIFTITIHPTPVVAAVSNITVCSGAAIGAIAFSANTAGGETFNWTNSNTLINLVASGIGNIAGFTAATNTTGVPIVATISVTGTKATCTGAPTTFTITVNPEPVVAAVANQAVCPATAINIPLTSNVSGAVLSWTNTNTAIGIAASGSGDIISTAPTNNTGVDIVGTITVVGTSATCVSAGANRKIFTITIHPTPVVAAVSNITVCSGAAIGAIAFSANTAGGETFNWTNSNILINLGASGIGNIAGFTAATNTTGVPIVATISVTGTKATCTGAPTTFTITVNPEPVVAAVANQAVCPATAINIPLTSNTAGAVLSWTNTNTAIGIAASGSGDIISTAPTNNTGVDIVGTITVVGTSATCVSAGANRKIFTITIHPTPVVAAVSNITVCSGAAIGAIAFSANTAGGETFNWTNSNTLINLVASGIGNIAGFTAATNTTGVPIVATISVTGTKATCTGAPTTFTITVNPEPVVAAVANQAVCPATAINIPLTSNTAGAVLSWTNTNPLIGIAASGTGDINYTAPTNNTGVDIVGTITVVGTSATCVSTGANRKIFTITIHPTPVVAAVSNITVCSGAAIGAIAFSANTAGGETFNWTNSNILINLGASGIGNIAGFTAATNTTGVPIVATISVTGTKATCTGAATTFTITVNPEPVVTAVANQAFCPATAINIPLTSNTAGAVLSWTNTNPLIGIAASGTGDINYTAPTNNTGVDIVGTITVVGTSATCVSTGANRKIFTITIHPTPVVAAVSNITVCSGAAIGAIAFSANTAGGETFNWTNSNTLINLGASGIGNIAGFTAATNTTGVPIVATINVTGTKATCTGAATTFTITVNPEPVVAVVANQAFCPATAINIPLTSNVVGAVLSWTNTNPLIGIAASGSGGINYTAPANNTGVDIVGTITVVGTNAGCVSAGANRQIFTITIHPTPVVTAVSNITVCSGAAIGAINFSANTAGGETFNWTNSNTLINLGASGIGNIAAFTAATNTTGVPIVATISVTGTKATCTGAPTTFTITINPEPVVAVVANQAFCPATAIAIPLTSNVAGAVLSWTNTNAAIGIGLSGTGDIIYTAPTNNTGVDVVGTITVVGTSATCVSTGLNRKIFTITIHPTPVVAAVSNISVCSGAAIGAINFTANTGGGETFNWTNSNTLINLGAGGIGNIPAFTSAANISGVPMVATISVTASKGGCTGTPTTFTITINPEPVVTALTNQAYCPATAITIPLTSNTTGAVLSWTNTNTAIGIAASGTGDIISTAPTNNTGVDIVGTITVVATSAGCVSTGANRQIFTITIHPTPVVAAVSNITVCSGAAIGAINFSANTAGGESFNWTNNNTGINLGASGIGNIAPFTAAINTTGVPIVATISVTGTKATCTGAPTTFTITVNPEPVVAAVANQAFCPATAISIPLTSNVAGAVLSWTNTNAAIGIATSGSGDIIYTAPTNNTGVDIVGTITVVGTSATCVSTGLNRKIFTITIHPTPVVAPVSDIVVCSGDPISAINFSANTAGGETFNWINSNTLINLGASGTGNIAAFTAATNTTGAPIIATISVTGTKTTCTGAATTFTITINPDPVVGLVPSQNFCPTAAINIPLTSNVPGAVLSWTNNNTAIGLPSTGNGDINYTAPNNLTGADITGLISVTGNYAGCSSSSPSQKLFTLTIHPAPVVAAVSDITVCSGGAIGAINFTANTLGGETFNWTNNNIGINLGASGIGNIPAFTAAVNTTAFPMVATIRVTATKNGCPGPVLSFDITINPEPVVSASLSAGVCSTQASGIILNTNGTSVAAASYTINTITVAPSLIPAGGNAVAGAGKPANAIVNDKFTNLTGGPLTVQYDVTPISAAGCSGAPLIITLTVNPEPVVSGALSTAVCSGLASSITLNTNGTSIAAATYTINSITIAPGLTAAGGNATTGPGKLANAIVNDKFTNGTSVGLTVLYNVTPISAGGCVGAALDITLTVNPEPVVSNTLNAAVCSGIASGITLNTNGTSVAAATYTINTITVAPGLTPNAGNATTGPGKLANAIVNDKFTNFTNGPLTVVYNVTPISAAGCVGAPGNITLTINPEPVVSPTLSTGVCSAQASGITLSTNGTSVAAASYTINTITVAPSLTPGGGNAVAGPGKPANAIVNDKFTNLTGGPLTVQYNVTPISAAGCVGAPIIITLTVNPEPVMNGGLSTAVCSGLASGITLNTNGTSIGATTYTINSISVASGLTAAGGNATTGPGKLANAIVNDKFTNGTSVGLTVVYNVTPVSAGGCVGVALDITLTVNPEPVVSSTLNAAVCSGIASGITLNTNGTSVGAATYTINTITVAPGLTPNGGNAVTGPGKLTNAIVNDKFTNFTNGSLTVVYNVTPISAAGCIGAPANITLTVNPEPVVSATLSTGVCSGVAGGVTLTTAATSIAAASYTINTITVALGLTPGGGNAVAGAGKPANAIVNDKFTNLTGGPLTVQYDVTPISAAGCTGAPVIITLTVNPEPVMSGGLSTAVCSGLVSGITLNTNGTSIGAATYTINSISVAPGLTAAGGNATTGTGKLAGAIAGDKFTNTSNVPLTVVYNIAPVSAGACLGAAINVTLTINPEPVVSSTLNAAVCSGSVSGITLNTNGTSVAAATYTINSITVAVGLTPVGGNATTGPGQLVNAIVNDKFTNVSGAPLTVIYNVTPVSGAACVGSPLNITLTVNPEPVGTTTVGPTFCSDTAVNYNLQTNVNATNTVLSNFSWMTTANANVGGESSTPQSGPVITDFLTNVSGSNQVLIYTITPTSISGCVGTNFTYSVTVQSKPVGSNTAKPAICSAAPFSYDPQPNITNGMTSTFSWIAAYGPGLVGGAGAGTGLLAETLTNLSNATQTATYTITPTSGGCVGLPFTIQVPVTPQPTGVSQSLTRCSNALVNTTLTTTGGSPAATSYTIAITPNGLTPVSGIVSGAGLAATELLDDKWKNTGSLPVNVVYDITPFNGTCNGAPFTVTVTYNPEPVGAPQTVAVCSDVIVNYNLLINVAMLGNNVGSTFSWVATPNGSVGNESTVPQSGPVITDALNNVTSVDQVVLYSVTPTAATGCAGAPFVITVTVHPEPVGTTLSGATSPEICSGNTVGFALQSDISNGVTSAFTWVVDVPNVNVTGQSTGLQSGGTINDILVNLTFSTQPVIYTVTPIGPNGCFGDPFTITVLVFPRAVISAGPDLAVCVNNSSIQLQGVSTYAPGGLSWSSSSSGTSGFAPLNNPQPNYSYNAGDQVTPPTLTLTALDPDGPTHPCPIQTDQMVLKVNKLPTLVMLNLPPAVAENATPIDLSAIDTDGGQTGGLFTIAPGNGIGPTVTGGDGFDHATFTPATSTVGASNSVTYTLTDANGCTNSLTKFVFVNAVTNIDFDLDQLTVKDSIGQFKLCSDQGLVHLRGFPAPSAGAVGSTITRFYFIPNPADSLQTIPLISQTGSEWYFDSNGALANEYIIAYDFENTSHVKTTKVYKLRMFGSPDAAIGVLNSCIISAINFTDASTYPAKPPGSVGNSPAPIIHWAWSYGDHTAIDTIQHPSHVYTASGLYDVVLRVTTSPSQNCVSQTTRQIRVGDVPVVNFGWSAICTNDSTKFKDKTNPGSISVITNYTWDFGDGHTVSGPNDGSSVPPVMDGGFTSGTFKNPNHKYVANGNYSASLTVDTNDGCQNTFINANLFILAYTTIQPVAGSGYTEDFEASQGGWQAQALDTLNPTLDTISWQWGTPTGVTINKASSGTNAWWTGINSPGYLPNSSYTTKEQTAVNGPCFDLSQLKRPMISFDYWSDAQDGFDGAVFQFSVDGGITWQNVGRVFAGTSDGINWHSPNQIISNPGQQSVGQYGWSGRSGGWVNARSNLDTIPLPRNQVRVRIAFSSDATNPPGTKFDGFAFDDVFVGDKKRNVLVEEFTNSELKASTDADAYLSNLYNNAIALRTVSDFNDIRYHVNYPNPDPFNIVNPTDPASRALFMQVPQPPYAIMDGRIDAQFTGNPYGIKPADIDRRALQDPKFGLTLTSSLGSVPNKINVKLNMVALDTLVNTPLIAQVVLMENGIVLPSKPTLTFDNVLRKQLFGSEGEISKNWLPGTLDSLQKVDMEITVPITDPTKLTLLGYIQDKNTHEIYQSVLITAPAVAGGPVTGITEPIPVAVVEEIQLFPNPANGAFEFGLPDHFPLEYTWKIVDQRGVDVLSGDFEGAVNGKKAVSVIGLPNAVYFVIIGAPEKTSVHRKLVVMNRQ